MEPKSPPSKSPAPSILDRLIKVDTTLSLHLHTTTQSILPHSLLKTLEISGDGRLFFPVAISLFLSPLSTTSHYVRLFLADLLIGSVVDLLLIGLIKHLVRRPRPVYNKGMSLAFAVDHWSFPSGHSSRVCFIAAFSYLSFELIGRALDELKSSGDRFVGDWIGLIGSDDGKVVGYIVLIVCLWSVVTSISRVFLGRHFVFDVVAGAFLGVFEALLVFHCLNYSILCSILS